MALRPLVRYLIVQGTTFPQLCAWLKSLYVQEAEALARGSAEAVTDSHVALLSGVHRKDVARLRRQPEAPLRPSRQASVAARVVAEWVTDEALRDQEGQVRVLPVRVVESGPSFEALVRRVKADLRANVVLEELVRVGVVERLERGQVKLLRQAYIADRPEEKLEFLGANVGDHMGAVVHNLTDAVPWLERAVYYDRIPPEQVDALRAELTQRAQQFLRDVNAQIMPRDQAAEGTSARRVRVGVYYYEENSDASGGAQ